MLSYQHAYHAGGPADVHKHAALAALLALLTAKPRPISYLETHAGRGVYDLDAPEAVKTGEAARGIDMLRVEPSTPYGAALDWCRRRRGKRAYPGSPWVAMALLRPGDFMALMELHPAEHAALTAVTPSDEPGAPRAALHRRDGRAGLKALTPPTPRRGLALIDPSYEVKEEYAQTALIALEAATRWPEGVVAIWYPVLPARRHETLLGPIQAVVEVDGALVDEVAFHDRPARGMLGSGLVVLNPPYGAAEALAQARRLGAPLYGPSAPGAG